MSPQERYQLMMSKTPDPELDKTAQRDLSEALYTLQEGGGISVDMREACDIYRAFTLVLAGGFTEDMRM